MAASLYAVHVGVPVWRGQPERGAHLPEVWQVTAADFDQACAEAFAVHCLRLDIDDALEIAAEYQISPTD